MPPASFTTVRFSTGHAIKAGDFYIERKADVELKEAIERGGFCHLLAPPRTGKTSLIARAIKALETSKRGRGTLITMQNVAPPTAPYSEFLNRLSLAVAAEIVGTRPSKPVDSTESLFEYLCGEVLDQVPGSVFIALDEIGELERFALDERRAFLALSKRLDSARVRNPELERLTVCLIGLSSLPALLGHDVPPAQYTSSIPIALDDLTFDEAIEPFAAALAQHGVPDALDVAKAVYAETQGHPYMIQKLGMDLVHSPRLDGDVRSRVRDLADAAFNKKQIDFDAGLSQARDGVRAQRASALRERGADAADAAVRPTHTDLPPERLAARLELYEKILKSNDDGEVVPAGDPSARDLWLAGLVSCKRGTQSTYVVRNPIFRRVFDEAWVHQTLVEAKRPFAKYMPAWRERRDRSILPKAGELEALTKELKGVALTVEEVEIFSEAHKGELLRRARIWGITLGVIASVLATLTAALGLAAENARQDARAAELRYREIETKRAKANKDLASATAARERAERERTEAENERAKAEAERAEAEQALSQAEKLRREAVERQGEAYEQTANAKRLADRARVTQSMAAAQTERLDRNSDRLLERAASDLEDCRTNTAQLQRLKEAQVAEYASQLASCQTRLRRLSPEPQKR